MLGVLGVDIYRYQTVTDWRALARSVGYAWVKLTDGNGPAVTRGDKQVNGCKSVGVPVGGYHWAQPGDPEHQASVFTGELRRLKALDLAPALDLEDEKFSLPTARDFGVRFCRAIARAGYRPAVYMSASWAGALRPDQWGIPNLIIWLAAYGTNDGERHSSAVARHYRGRYDVHQYTSNGRVPGISGAVDLNWSTIGVPRNGTNTEDDMALTDPIDWDEVTKLGPNTPAHKILSTWQHVSAIRQASAAQNAAIAGLAKLIAADTTNDLTEDQVRQAVREEIANATIDVDVTVGGQAVEQPAVNP